MRHKIMEFTEWHNPELMVGDCQWEYMCKNGKSQDTKLCVTLKTAQYNKIYKL